jgi:hypothetical protein
MLEFTALPLHSGDAKRKCPIALIYISGPVSPDNKCIDFEIPGTVVAPPKCPIRSRVNTCE